MPSAGMGMMTSGLMAGGAVVAWVWHVKLSETMAMCGGPIGAAFTAITLITGSLWGRPTWGTYWVWDARLTSVLVLFFLYLGYMALSEAFDDEQRGLRAASILALVGFCLLYTSPSPRDRTRSRMPSSA